MYCDSYLFLQEKECNNTNSICTPMIKMFSTSSGYSSGMLEFCVYSNEFHGFFPKSFVDPFDSFFNCHAQPAAALGTRFGNHTSMCLLPLKFDIILCIVFAMEVGNFQSSYLLHLSATQERTAFSVLSEYVAPAKQDQRVHSFDFTLIISGRKK